ncbi:MAG: Mur ligase family protein [Gammaproteobacteria bacterium]|nr:Mur ligase family protein [Gammaproteobacteria bacterium]
MNTDNKIFIAGIGGVFMAGLAQLAKARGYTVRGCDAGVYPPMSDVLAAHGIDFDTGYLPQHLGDAPGQVVIGNALSRGNALVEAVLERGLEFCSGPEWLRAHVLRKREVIAVAGTHGKTSTASMLAWILECNGDAPGFLIGGQPGNFDCSARLGGGEHFVIEADEYDTAFFDKRAKFVHYHPRIAVLNNLEFDHADIYADTTQIIRQFHHLLRLVPGRGCVVVNAGDGNLAKVIDMGCWSRLVKFSVGDGDGGRAGDGNKSGDGNDGDGDDGDGGDGNDGDGGISRHPRSLLSRHPRSLLSGGEWRASPLDADCARFDVLHHGRAVARVEWTCIGRHNMGNALAAIAAAEVAGVSPANAAQSLRDFIAVARRMQCLLQSDAVVLYDDFAHHPTAIAATLDALRAREPRRRIIAVLELRSNTMKAGVHGAKLTQALARADCAIICGGDGDGDGHSNSDGDGDGDGYSDGDGDGDGDGDTGGNADENIQRIETTDAILAAVQRRLRELGRPAAVITMSNGDFGGLPGRLAAALGASANA